LKINQSGKGILLLKTDSRGGGKEKKNSEIKHTMAIGLR
jgi:hypothetical protein